MEKGLEKLAAHFQAATKGMDEGDLILMGAAAETVLLQKEAGAAVENLTEDEIILLSAAITDDLLGR